MSEENVNFDDVNNEEDIVDFINNNPLLKRAKETCKLEDEKVDKYVEGILDDLREKVETKEISIKTAILVLSKCLGYTCQGFMKSEEEFFSEKETANRLVINNVYPALGAFANNEEANKTGIVEYKGEVDEGNFNFKRLVLTGVALIEYSNWKIHLAQASRSLEKENV